MSDLKRAVPLTNEEYVESSGQRCPYCTGESTLQADAVEVSGSSAYQNVVCLESEGGCGAEFTDEFTLTGYTPAE